MSLVTGFQCHRCRIVRIRIADLAILSGLSQPPGAAEALELQQDLANRHEGRLAVLKESTRFDGRAAVAQPVVPHKADPARRGVFQRIDISQNTLIGVRMAGPAGQNRIDEGQIVDAESTVGHVGCDLVTVDPHVETVNDDPHVRCLRHLRRRRNQDRLFPGQRQLILVVVEELDDVSRPGGVESVGPVKGGDAVDQKATRVVVAVVVIVDRQELDALVVQAGSLRRIGQAMQRGPGESAIVDLCGLLATLLITPP